ncbi:hypothetical protein [Oceanobacillus profundus]|uniref:Nuclease SbcCD subunit C n=1 Tax=Oceanobacillus profundus TaxID=372463 RepID=A0A417YK96_9BACI|nr:hypothetical protein [Oceanobacillus profundus]RHW33546.1 hypothetical protein D1B32_05760 [Oceanobacillus profundus]
MKKIILLKLELTNFKGIKHQEFTFNGMNAGIFGENGTGKTTAKDGFIWLLFDKDSQNQKEFGIKTLRDGKVIHKLNHEVEAVFLIDDRKLSLKKVFTEKWTKKRGSITANFTGHTTDYYVDDVPSKKKEYEEIIKSIVEEDVFKLLTSPGFFNENVHWKDRRDLLLEIAGDITDEDVIRTNSDLSKLIDVLSGRSIEDHKKVITAKRKEINQELDRIPIRIDELYRGMPDTGGLSKENILSELDNLADEIDSKLSNINNLRSGSEVNNLKMKISEIDMELANVKKEHAQQGQQELYSLKAKLQEEQSNVGILQSRVSSFEQRKSINSSNIKDLEERMGELRNQWIERNTQEFDHENSCSCPTCGQDLPEEQKEEALANFNRNKAQLLETINKKGVELKEKLQILIEENERADTEINKLNQQVSNKQSEIIKLETKIKESESNIKPISENPLYQKLMNDRQVSEQEIETLKTSVEASVQEVQIEIQTLKEKQNALTSDLSSLNESGRVKSRIAELEEQQQNLAAEFERLEHELFLAEEFVKTKVNLLTEKINSKFKYARFNLFKEHINGGLEETCETTYEGVPYSSGLNNAARINVGLDIINTLSEHYGVQAPIFVDNAESVTKLIDIDAQVISLIVSEEDKELRIEVKEEREAA